MTHESPVRKKSGPNRPRVGAVLTAGETLRRVAVAWAALATLALAATRAAEPPSGPEPERARLRGHVETLASPEFGGRRGEVAEKSRAYLIEAFRALKLEPLFEGSYYQDILDREPGPAMGRNVGAKLVGSDPKLRDEWVIVAAHFDHLGVRDGVLYPGADDNASAVAMMLEVARCLVASHERPRRSVMFVGFDLEERGLVGSRYFAEHPPVPLGKVALFVTADMIGRAVGGVGTDLVFIMGTERWPSSRSWIREASAGKPLRVAMLGTDILLYDRSDYGPFRSRHVPFLFFTTAESPRYHSPLDNAETLDYPKAEAISRVIYGVVRKAIQADDRPAWRDSPDNGMDEARALRVVLRIFLDHADELKIGKTPSFLLTRAIGILDGVEARGRIEPGERTNVIRMTQVVMAAIF